MNMTVIGSSYTKFSELQLNTNNNHKAETGSFNHLSSAIKNVKSTPLQHKFSQNRASHFNVKNIKNFANQITTATEKVINDTDNTEIKQKLNKISQSIDRHFKYELDTDKVSKKNINFVADMKKKLVNLIAIKNLSTQSISAKQANELAKKSFSSALNAILNNQEWNTITKSVDIESKCFTSHLTPAGKMKWASGNDIFPVSYNDKGVSSSSTTETNHSTNLWNSHFSVNENGQNITLFSGFRHGTLCPFGIDDPNLRLQGAINRGKEIITSALFMDKEKLRDALNGKEVTLHITSTSLETALDSSIANIKEKTQIATQLEAWKTLSSATQELEIMDANNQSKIINVNVDVAAFNVGVNNLASGYFNIGKNWSEQANKLAAEKLLGALKDKSVGGWVGDFLSHNTEQDGTKILQTAIKLKQFFQGKHTSYEDRYQIAKDIALLSYQIDSKPCWNCKSGKDRTGMLDTVIKSAVVNDYTKTNKQENFNKVLLNSGSLDIQELNTGLPGNKVLKRNALLDLALGKTGLREKIQDKDVIQNAKGGAKIA